MFSIHVAGYVPRSLQIHILLVGSWHESHAVGKLPPLGNVSLILAAHGAQRGAGCAHTLLSMVTLPSPCQGSDPTNCGAVVSKRMVSFREGHHHMLHGEGGYNLLNATCHQ